MNAGSLLQEMNDLTVLGIETSGHTASAAVCDEGRIIAEESVFTRLTHSQVIMPMCRRVMDAAEVTFKDIDCIAVAKGPGSYTGLRIGIAAVKGICMAADIKCAGISTLMSLAYNFRGIDCVVCSAMYARGELVYGAFFKISGTEVKRLTDDRIMSVSDIAAECAGYGRVYVVGDHAEALCEKYGSGNIICAPPQLRLQRASSLCFAALDGGMISPDELNADYLQITKAEKDLAEAGKK